MVVARGWGSRKWGDVGPRVPIFNYKNKSEDLIYSIQLIIQCCMLTSC